MPDREKVIKGFEICSQPGSCRSECPYYEKEGTECSYWLMKDALELLKAQEAVEAKVVGESESHGSWWFACGACGHAIDPEDNFCRECGRKVKWYDA